MTGNALTVFADVAIFSGDAGGAKSTHKAQIPEIKDRPYLPNYSLFLRSSGPDDNLPFVGPETERHFGKGRRRAGEILVDKIQELPVGGTRRQGFFLPSPGS